MAYYLLDVNGQIITQHDLQDKGVWCRTGFTKEMVFVEKFGKELNLIIHPAKESNPYGPDLFNISNGTPGDLKTQNTPFFQVSQRFGYDPQYAVVFNGKDRKRYRELYPEMEIYFAVDWQVITFKGVKTISVVPMTGVWFIPFSKLDQLLQSAPFHSYYQRRNDEKGNAKGSYVLNLLDKNFTKVI